MNETINTIFGNAKLNNYGYYVITSSKEGNSNKFLHRLIYESFWNVKLPNEIHVHHKDGNKLNNCILNLEALPVSDHLRLHKKGGHCSKETRQKMSKAKKGKKHPMYGKYHSDESKNKISEANKGKTPWNKNKTLSEETKQKMSEAKKGKLPWNKDKKLSNKHKQKISESKTLNYYRIIKAGVRNGKQDYIIVKSGKRIKGSNNKEKLLNMFLKEHPLEIIKVSGD